MPDNRSQIADIAEAFEFLGDWEQRYQYLIELGERLPAMDAVHKTNASQVHGCVSNVWLIAERDEDNPSALRIYGDSDNSTVRGLVAILLAMYSGQAAEKIVAMDADRLFDELGLYDHLSPTRHVGVYAMVEKIKCLARDYAITPEDRAPLEAREPLNT